MSVNLNEVDFSDLKNYPNIGKLPDGSIDEFSFNGNGLLRAMNQKLVLTNEAIEEWKKCKEDRNYFIENYVYIIVQDVGLIIPELRDYQYETLDIYDNNRYVLNKSARRSGKTVTAAMYLLHKICFNKDFTIGVVANRNALVGEILGLIQQMYEMLPPFLQSGIKKFSAQRLELANGCKVITSVMSSNSLRGNTIDITYCVHYNETITVRNKKTGIIETLPIGKFYDRIMKQNNEYEILTKDGFKDFSGIQEVVNRNDIIKFIFDDSDITVLSSHRFYTGKNSNGKIFRQAKNININNKIDGKIVKDIIKLDDIGNNKFYDVTDVNDGNHYITSGVTSHNCDEFSWADASKIKGFTNSVFPIISASKTGQLIVTTTPNGFDEFYKLWKESKEGLNDFKTIEIKWDRIPGRDQEWYDDEVARMGIPYCSQNHNVNFLGSSKTLLNVNTLDKLSLNKKSSSSELEHINPDFKCYEDKKSNGIYIIGVDTSKSSSTSSQKDDYISVQVGRVDIYKKKIYQVATMKTKEIHYLELAPILYDLGMYYNEALIQIENNEGAGQSTVDHLFEVLEYENILRDEKRSDINGVRTTKQSKAIGLSNLRKLIESDILEVYDSNTIDDFFVFVRNGSSFAAQGDEHDDTVMALMLMISFLLQPDNELEIELIDFFDTKIIHEENDNIENDTEDLDFIATSNQTNEDDNNWLLG